MKKYLPIFCLFLFIASCSGVSKQSNFYVLTIEVNDKQLEPDNIVKNQIRIGIMPISIPNYLDRPQMVLHENNSSKITLGEYDRWAEPLNESIARIIAENISTKYKKLSASAVYAKHSNINYYVVIKIQKLDATLNKQVELDAGWTITAKNGKILKQGRTQEFTPAGNTYESVVKGESYLIGILSDDIAKFLPNF